VFCLVVWMADAAIFIRTFSMLVSKVSCKQRLDSFENAKIIYCK
jgi:hypothetical protein